MAARNIVNRIIKNEATALRLRSGVLRPLSSTTIQGQAPVMASKSPMAAQPSIITTHTPQRANNNNLMQRCPPPSASSFSTMPSNRGKKKKQQQMKKSPHSKLLRVCSERNSNAHFAAIEADMLRLNWEESMNALVEDWITKDSRTTGSGGSGDFIELERNVRSYIHKNLVDLTLIESACVQEWEMQQQQKQQQNPNNDNVRGDNKKNGGGISLADHFRFHLFPYENIISRIVHNAVSGRVTLSPLKRKEMGNDASRIKVEELRERVKVLGNAGLLLDAMCTFDEADDGESDDGANGGAGSAMEDIDSVLHNEVIAATADSNDDVDADSEQNTKAKANKTIKHGQWTTHHAACSNCHRRIVSGYFILNRRLGEARKEMIANLSGAELMKATETTTAVDMRPDQEMYAWVEKWMAFCGGVDGIGDEVRQQREGAISESDRALFTGVIKVLTVSGDAKLRAQAEGLSEQMDGMFLEE